MWGGAKSDGPGGPPPLERAIELTDSVDWKPREKDLKSYPHFDGYRSAEDASALACDRDAVASHAFYPFILVNTSWTKFAKKGQKGKVKIRPIRYACRSDAYIYTKYRHELSPHYEAMLTSAGLDQSIIAYRRIEKTDSNKGKCNIDFAKEAFDEISKQKNCYVIALDISSFFETLDHHKIRSKWESLLGEQELPKDHEKVFKSITSYAVVDKIQAYEALGFYGKKRKDRAGNDIKGYLVPYKKIPMQLCTGSEFQEKIASAGIIKKNFKPYGIPQGSPISDLIANFYLFDFDKEIRNMTEALGGRYFRYSDDILIVVPSEYANPNEIAKKSMELIKKEGKKIKIKPEKTSVIQYYIQNDKQYYAHIQGEQGKNGLEYLGFRFDGNHAYIRNGTISNLRRKVKARARSDAKAWVTKNTHKTLDELLADFNYEIFLKKFRQVEDFENLHNSVRNWTFVTYAKRAAKVFSDSEHKIWHQIRKIKSLCSKAVKDEIIAEHSKLP